MKRAAQRSENSEQGMSSLRRRSSAPLRTRARDYDSDEELPDGGDGDASRKQLHWTMDPSESLSDWTICIRSSRTIVSRTAAAVSAAGQEGSHPQNSGDDDDKDQEDEEDEQTSDRIDTYHVHRNVLAVGPRQSEYFAALLKNPTADFSEMKTGTSTVELHELAADSFPDLLDYIYSAPKGDPPKLTTGNAVALHYLGRYFQVRPLLREARKFWQTDLDFDNAGTYFRHGRIFQNDRLVDTIVDMCAENVTSVSIDSNLVDAADSQFWLDVMEQRKSSETGASEAGERVGGVVHPRDVNDEARSSCRHMSRLVARHCSPRNKNGVDADTFARLTDPAHLPHVHADAACSLLDAERRLVCSDRRTASNKKSGRRHQTPRLTCLQERCVRALSSGWETVDVTDPEMTGFLSRQDPLILSELFVSSLSTAQSNQRREREESKRLKRELDETANENKRLRTELDRHRGAPLEIYVEGAGSSAVNGRYVRYGIFQAAFRYVMEGRWNGDSHRFQVFRCRCTNATLHWYIAVVPPGEEPGTSSDIDFYTAPETDGDHVSPPHRGWARANEGTGPAPTVSYESNNDSDTE